ncbi:MAG: hypothetical protein ABI885_11815 [Gammaproteobacteria bacterium]
MHFTRGLPVLVKSPEGLWIDGARGVSDLQRGNQARLTGRLDEAERDLYPLALRGYPDAQLYLAAVYGQRETMAAQDDAARWYRAVLPLRPEAAIPLARVLARRGDGFSVLEAERLLLQAQIEPGGPAGSAALLELYARFPQLDVGNRAAAMAKSADESRSLELRAAAIHWYRASLDSPDHARRLLESCRKNLDSVPMCYVDLATYYRYSADDKTLDALVTRAMQSLQPGVSAGNFDSLSFDPVELPPIAGRLAVAMVNQSLDDAAVQGDPDFAPVDEGEIEARTEAEAGGADAAPASPASVAAQLAVTSQPAAVAAAPVNGKPELADRILRWMLKQQGAMAVEAAGAAVSFPYLLPDVDVEAVLSAGVAEGIPRASLYLGELYYFNQRVPRAAQLSEANLQRCLQYRETIADGHYRLGRLYQQGYLGTPDPQRALDHFLYAARRRITSADTHLARLFYDSPGARVDRINSYVFARLSEDGGVPVVIHTLRGGVLSSYGLLDRLRSELTPEQLKKAESLYEHERKVHLVTRPSVSPVLWVKKAG